MERAVGCGLWSVVAGGGGGWRVRVRRPKCNLLRMTPPGVGCPPSHVARRMSIDMHLAPAQEAIQSANNTAQLGGAAEGAATALHSARSRWSRGS